MRNAVKLYEPSRRPTRAGTLSVHRMNGRFRQALLPGASPRYIPRLMDLATLLLEQKLATATQLEKAQQTANQHGMHLVQAIVQQGHLSEDTLADTVARALGTVVIDVERGTLERDSVRLIPEGDARRHLAIPVAKGPSKQLRVAFANPLDPEPFRLIQSLTGMSIDPLVATASAIHAVLDREWRGRTTEMIEGTRVRSELPAESTRQLSPEEKKRRTRLREGLAGSDTGSVLIHSVVQQTTIEQRHEALLLTLIEKGLLTRTEYLDTLKRLLGGGAGDL